MGFATTAEVFHLSLRSFLAFACIAQEYTLLFDAWIITRPDASADAAGQWKKWTSVLKTALAYAFLEPVWYWLVTSITNMVPFCLIFAGFLHIHGTVGACSIMADYLEEVLSMHKKLCVATTPEELAQKEEETAVVEESKESHFLPTSTAANSTNPQPPIDVSRCMHLHPLPRLYFYANLIPTATAAMANAGLLYYARYLGSEDSQHWFDKFAFGWTTIALLCACVIPISRWGNKQLSKACGRPSQGPLLTRSWDVRRCGAAALISMISVRAIVRSLLSQDPITTISLSGISGVEVLGAANFADGPGMSEGGSPHWFDRILSFIPPWLGATFSIVNALVVWGKIFYDRRQSRRKQAAERESRHQ